MEGFLPAKKIFLPTLPHWTKSLRDSLELTALVMLCGMRGCDTWDRRRECLDHAVVFHARHLTRLLASYFASYYHRWRCHLSLAQE